MNQSINQSINLSLLTPTLSFKKRYVTCHNLYMTGSSQLRGLITPHLLEDTRSFMCSSVFIMSVCLCLSPPSLSLLPPPLSLRKRYVTCHNLYMTGSSQLRGLITAHLLEVTRPFMCSSVFIMSVCLCLSVCLSPPPFPSSHPSVSQKEVCYLPQPVCDEDKSVVRSRHSTPTPTRGVHPFPCSSFFIRLSVCLPPSFLPPAPSVSQKEVCYLPQPVCEGDKSAARLYHSTPTPTRQHHPFTFCSVFICLSVSVCLSPPPLLPPPLSLKKRYVTCHNLCVKGLSQLRGHITPHLHLPDGSIPSRVVLSLYVCLSPPPPPLLPRPLSLKKRYVICHNRCVTGLSQL